MSRSSVGVYPSTLRQANERRKKVHSFRGSIEGKVCSKCEQWKSLDDFTKDNRCKECIRRKSLAYYHKHSKEINAKNSEKRSTPEHRAAIKDRLAAYERKRREDPAYRIKKALRHRVWSALRGEKKCERTLELLGCSLEEFKKHLESQFTEGMSWENYGRGGWEIDHIRPCASFDLSDPLDQQICFHYSNMQPLWAADNRAKGDSW